MRTPALLFVALMLLPSASADWLQRGVDGQRSSWTAERGPAWGDVALELPIANHWGCWDPAGPTRPGPVVVGGRAYVLVSGNVQFDCNKLNVEILEVDLATGTNRSFARHTFTPSPIQSPAHTFDIASDGVMLFTRFDDAVEAYALDTLERTWTASLRPSAVSALPAPDVMPQSRCSDLALQEGTLVVGCAFYGTQLGGSRILSVHALRVQDGSLVWTWLDRTETSPKHVQETAILEPSPQTPSTEVTIAATASWVIILEDNVITGSDGTAQERRYWDWWALHFGNGTYESRNSQPPVFLGAVPLPPNRNVPLRPTACDPYVFRPVALIEGADSPYADVHDSTTLAYLQNMGWGGAGRAGVAIACGADGVFVAADNHVFAYTPELLPLWDVVLPTDAAVSPRDLVRAADALYLATPLTRAPSDAASIGRSTPAGYLLWARDAKTGDVLWQHAFKEPLRYAISDGLAVVLTPTRLVILGQTAASIRVNAQPSDAYPQPGDIVRMDLGSTTPGLLGPATEFRADWGDGTSTDWGNSSVLEHRYAQPQDVTARFFARNAAGQTASTAAEFYVGRAPPQNFLQEQFSNKNQERTFFILGAAGSGLIALFGFLRLQRRRNVLARELADLDRAVYDARRDATLLDQLLDERRLRARALLLSSKLDENQHAVLAAHIEELSRAARLDVVHQQLDFLPFRHVRALREMLQDGRITSLERAHYLAMLDSDATLTADYKARVRSVIDEWAAHDAAGVSR